MNMPQVFMNDFARQWSDTAHEVLDATNRVGASGWYVLGKEVSAFEREVGAFAECGSAVGCASGLDAIEISLRALGVKAGDKVLTTPVSAFATTLAIVRSGGVPVFVDVDATGLIDLRLAADILAADPEIRYFLPVHLFGQALPLSILSDLKAKFGITVVEDMAQALGAKSGERRVGTVGDAAATSFYPTKNLGALGDGGALFARSDSVERLARSLRDYGQSAKYEHEHIGLNSRLDELHAAILRTAFLPKLPSWTARRRAIASAYSAGIKHEAVVPLPQPEHSESVWHLYPVSVVEGQRSGLMAHLKANGIQSGVHYPTIIPDQRALAGVPHEVHGPLPNASRLAQCELSLPIHPYLQDEEVERVISHINLWRPA